MSDEETERSRDRIDRYVVDPLLWAGERTPTLPRWVEPFGAVAFRIALLLAIVYSSVLLGDLIAESPTPPLYTTIAVAQTMLLKGWWSP